MQRRLEGVDALEREEMLWWCVRWVKLVVARQLVLTLVDRRHRLGWNHSNPATEPVSMVP